MRGMWLCEGWAVPRWLATMVPAWVGSTGWNLVPAWYLLLYLLLLLRLLLRLLLWWLLLLLLLLLLQTLLLLL